MPGTSTKPRIKQSLQLAATLELMAAKAGDPPELPRFEMTANTGRPMRLSGFSDQVIIDLTGAKFDKESTPVVMDHDTGRRIGHTTEQSITIGAKGTIAARGVVSSTSADAQAFVADSRNKYPFQTSVGADILKAYFVPEDEVANVNGQEWPGPLIVASQTNIRELTVTTLGADSSTSSKLAANLKRQKMPKRNTPIDIENEDVTTDLEASRDQIATEEERLDGIRAAFRNPDYQFVDEVELEDGKTIKAASLKAKAIREGWTANETEVLLLRASRPRGAMVGRPVSPRRFNASADTTAVMTAALLLKAGRQSIAEKTMPAQVLEAAHPHRSASLIDFCKMALEAEGRPIPIGRGDVIRAALSTVILPEALGGGMDKLIGVAFLEGGATWRSFAAPRDLMNFREHTIISPQHRGQLLELPPGGEIKHGQITEDTSTLKLSTFAKMLSLDRQEIFADDLSIFGDITTNFAIQALRTVNDLVYSVIMANAGNHYHADNNNLLTGAGSALSLTSLGNAVTAMRKQKDGEGNDVDISPAVLVVPPELEHTARALLNSIELARDTTTDDNLPTANPLKSIATLEVESRLSNSTKFANASTTAWYVMSSPVSAPLYIAGLDGILKPVVESFGLDHVINRLCYSWRVFIDAGAALGEPRASVKSNGA